MFGAVCSPDRPSRNAKRLIVCCDGTWQDSTSDDADVYPSNVTRLSRAFSRYAFDKDGQEVEQIVYYQKGVGTGMMDRMFGGVLGIGVSANIRAAYSFLASNYDEGDSIYIFGFSRGAFTARALGGLIADTGLLTKRGMDQFPELYTIYYDYRERHAAAEKNSKTNGKPKVSPSSTEAAQAFINALGPEMVSVSAASAVRIIGVWDTVSYHHPEMLPKANPLELFGMRSESERIEFADINVPERVEYAFQALALDETRKAYSPIMWTLPKEKPAQTKVAGAADLARRPRLKQVWFSGEHSDIGGGRSNPRLSDVSLAWMISECVKTGLLVFDPKYLLANLPTVSAGDRDPSLDQEGDLPVDSAPWGTFYGTTTPKARPLSHKVVNSVERLAGTVRRKPLQFATDGLVTNESLHESVLDRVFHQTRLDQLVAERGYPKDGVVYEMPDFRPEILVLDGAQLSPSLEEWCREEMTDRGMEVVDWEEHLRSGQGSKSPTKGAGLVGRFIGLWGGGKGAEKDKDGVNGGGSHSRPVFIPIVQCGRVEMMLKNRIRSANHDALPPVAGRQPMKLNAALKEALI